jgi:hypothetical protein
MRSTADIGRDGLINLGEIIVSGPLASHLIRRYHLERQTAAWARLARP